MISRNRRVRKMDDEQTKKAVRDNYAKLALMAGSCGCGPSCCPGSDPTKNINADDMSKGMGYSEEDLTSLPKGANLGLGCGNPVALGLLKEGETFLDLGSGAGIDCFLAARRVGPEGRAIGVDMTHEMLAKARENAKEGDYDNVEFRLGEIEHLPVADSSVDVIASNCVINLSPDKRAVFAEAYRTLRPGGRLMISDIVLLRPLPDSVLRSVEAYVGCVSGAIPKDDYLKLVEDAGFGDVTVHSEAVFTDMGGAIDQLGKSVADGLKMSEEEAEQVKASIASIKFSAVKP